MLNFTVKQLAADLAARRVSSVEVTQYFIKRINALGKALNAFISVDEEQSLASARAADQRLAAGKGGPLTGIPLAHKDIFCAKGWLTTCGSKILSNFVAPYDAHVIERFTQAGAVIAGKTNMDEFAMGSSNETSFYGPVQNPWDTAAVPGGSSGGSAAAVAARLAPAATGTDTGGSIRQPAAFTGICGLKPTYGVVSRYGMIAFASSLDQGGPFAKTAEDLALMLNVMAGFDARDSTSLQRVPEDYTRELAQPLQGLRIGLPAEFFAAGLASDVAFDGVRYGYRAPEYSDLLDMYCKTRAQGFGAEVKRRILIGTYVLSHGYYDAYYIKAQKLRRLIAQDFAEAFRQCDVIMGPTTPTTAFNLGEKAGDPVQMYLSDIYTIAVNLAGLPGMSIPAGFGDRNHPVGLQLIGNYFGEAKMLNAAHQYQQATDWHLRMPDGIQGEE
ncbi:MAG: Asp-tRNA(Asn)/Glu-tRNA(Gln) amidotransferase subunit GatA [Betaproteobacteria bacterium]|nr:Asp-tRNA(Asn)/Glu-tRNA(Gln) amidotransferase subunit GatA [Betaproteobacteria bacterium]